MEQDSEILTWILIGLGILAVFTAFKLKKRNIKKRRLAILPAFHENDRKMLDLARAMSRLLDDTDQRPSTAATLNSSQRMAEAQNAPAREQRRTR